MCDEAVNTYNSTNKFIIECLMAQKKCDKLLDAFLAFDCILYQYKTQDMCETIVSEDPSLTAYCTEKYKTQRMFDEAVNNCLAALKRVPDWFVPSELIKKPFTALYAEEKILQFNEGSCDGIFICNGIGIINTDNFDEDYPDTINLI